MTSAAATQMDSHVLLTSWGRRSQLISTDAPADGRSACVEATTETEMLRLPSGGGDDSPQPYGVVRPIGDPAWAKRPARSPTLGLSLEGEEDCRRFWRVTPSARLLLPIGIRVESSRVVCGRPW